MSNLLFVSHTSEISGPTYRLLTLLRRLGKQHKAVVVAPAGGPLFEALEQIGIKGHHSSSRGLTREMIPWLRGLILSEGFDLVYGNNYSTDARNALIAARLSGRPFIWHINEMLEPAIKHHWRKAVFLPLADAVIADSLACALSVSHHLKKKVHQIYNGVELNEQEIDKGASREHLRKLMGVSDDYLVVIHAGIVCERKGQEFGVSAALDLLNRFPSLAFAFLGDLNTEPVYVRKLRERVAAANKEKEIQFLGFREDFDALLHGADVFLHTASRDPHPLVVLHAMNAELPVAAFSVDGVEEQVVDGETGYLVPFGDLSALEHVLEMCLQSPSGRRSMGESGRKRVESLFSADVTAQKIMDVIVGVLKQKG